MPSWTPEIVVDAALVARAVAQWPELADRPIQALGAGWDNSAFLVDDAWLFRFPRRAFGRDAIEVEIRWCPQHAPRLPLAIPVPERIGGPLTDYPWRFAGHRLIAGETACRVSWTPDQRTALAPVLGRFLRALHALPVPADAPPDHIHRADLVLRAPKTADRLAEQGATQAVVDLARQLAHTPTWDRPPVWVHGDLYGRHVVVDDRRHVTGIIDWGDCHAGDPAGDLSIGWSFFGPADRERFLDAYGPVDAATRARAQARTLQYASFLMPYGLAEGDDAMRRLGELALVNATA
ncbi:MAG: aminoglycoside phosphotransferase (APT) family kinase protein [Myxococcota bacterium]|jgi:aminoglycoside phosphotransferase (APT) family kinase protein